MSPVAPARPPHRVWFAIALAGAVLSFVVAIGLAALFGLSVWMFQGYEPDSGDKSASLTWASVGAAVFAVLIAVTAFSAYRGSRAGLVALTVLDLPVVLNVGFLLFTAVPSSTTALVVSVALVLLIVVLGARWLEHDPEVPPAGR